MKVSINYSNNHLHDSGYSLDEQEELYDLQLMDLLMNPRWYLDNLGRLSTYRLRWHDYRTKTAPLPYHLVRKEKPL